MVNKATALYFWNFSYKKCYWWKTVFFTRKAAAFDWFRAYKRASLWCSAVLYECAGCNEIRMSDSFNTTLRAGIRDRTGHSGYQVRKWVSGQKVGLRSKRGSKVRKLVSGQKVCLKSKSRSHVKKWVSCKKWVSDQTVGHMTKNGSQIRSGSQVKKGVPSL